jgi:hypothetical protein
MFINSTLLAVLLLTFWITYRYRICIADEEFRIYEVSFNILAASTSALADMMVAYDTRF